MNVVDLVQKLIALSASPNVEEGRTAAYKACQLIRTHKLRVSELPRPRLESHPTEPAPPESKHKGKGPARDPLDDLFEDYLRQAEPDAPGDVLYATSNIGMCIGCGDDIVSGPYISELGLMLYHAKCYPGRGGK